MIKEKYNDSVLVCSTLLDVAPEALPDYVLYYLCLTGTCTFAYGMREHRFRWMPKTALST